MIRVTREDFESFKRHNDPEVFTAEQINTWVKGMQELIQKSETNELDEVEKAMMDQFNAEFGSFMQVEVVGKSSDLLTKGLSYDRFYVREQQVEFEKAEGDDIEKARHGKYLNTALNRKLGRVGQEYGKVSDEGFTGEKTEASQHSKEELDEFGDFVSKLAKENKEKEEKEKEGGEKEEGTLQKVKRQLDEAPIGATASGGGYGTFTKKGKDHWVNSNGTIKHSEALSSHIGGFDDFKLK